MELALKSCPECGGKVSSQAAACPHCGYRLGHTPIEAALAATARDVVRGEKPSCMGKLTGCLFWILVVVVLMYVISYSLRSNKEDGMFFPAANKAVPAK